MEDYRSFFEEFSGHPIHGERAIQIKPGDWYLAKRNGPARILQCKINTPGSGWIVPTSNAYYYDVQECFRLKPEFTEDDIILHAVELEIAYSEWVKSLQ